jgi:hypothetical protein
VATSSDLAMSLLVMDERNQPSPYFHAIVLEQPQGPLRPPTLEAAQVLVNEKKRRGYMPKRRHELLA